MTLVLGENSSSLRWGVFRAAERLRLLFLNLAAALLVAAVVKKSPAAACEQDRLLGDV